MEPVVVLGLWVGRLDRAETADPAVKAHPELHIVEEPTRAREGVLARPDVQVLRVMMAV
jgi:hypothetical protein